MALVLTRTKFWTFRTNANFSTNHHYAVNQALRKMSFTTQVVVTGKLVSMYFCRSFRFRLSKKVNSYQAKYFVELGGHSRTKKNLNLQNGKPLKIQIPEMIIHPIPSKTDFGAVASEGVFLESR